MQAVEVVVVKVALLEQVVLVVALMELLVQLYRQQQLQILAAVAVVLDTLGHLLLAAQAVLA
jgi:hypothetical protein